MKMKCIIRRGSVAGVGLALALAGCGGQEQGAASGSEALGTQAQALNVVTNGSFEQQAIGYSNYVNLSAGSTQLTGWTVTGGIKVMHSRYKATANGYQCIDLNGSYGAGAVSQNVPTVPGSGYTVRFAISNSPNCATSWRYGTLTFGTQSVSLSNASGAWQYRSYVFNATDSSTVLKLASTSTGVGCGLAIDDLTVTGP
jgi:choice-of-anchor C domain-containing protein